MKEGSNTVKEEESNEVDTAEPYIFVSEHAFALKNLLTLLGSKEPRQVTSNFWEAQKLNIYDSEMKVSKRIM